VDVGGKTSSMVPIPSKFPNTVLFSLSLSFLPFLLLLFNNNNNAQHHSSQLWSTTTRPTRVPRQRSPNPLRLDTTKPLQLLGLHRDLLPEPDLPRRALDKAHTVRVQRLVDRRCARLGAGDGDAGGRALGGLELVSLAEPFDDGGFHREFDPVEWDEPDNVLRIIDY